MDMQNVRLVRGTKLIYADCDGTLDLPSSRDVLCQLLSQEIGTSDEQFDLLFDVRGADIDLSMSDIWTLVQDIDECAPEFGERLALLDHWDETFDRMQFMEASAHEVGLHHVRAFIDFESAVDWLWDS